MKRSRIFDFYLFKNLFIATAFVSVTLAAVIFLTQSLKFIELVIGSGASSSAFWVLTFLALPRFFEIIMPLSLMAATLFVYNRMTMDSELVAMRATGASPLSLARPALYLAGIVTLFMFVITMWAAPSSLSRMLEMRQVIKAQVSSLLFREGVFNAVTPGLTVYLRERGENGELLGLMIYDSREKGVPPSTILAKKGQIAATPDGHKVFVYDGSRQEFNAETSILQKLDFQRYTIDLPEGGAVRQRWKEPDERTIEELVSPNLNVQADRENLHEFKVEIHRRIINPLLAPVFTLLALNSLLVGPTDRRGQGRRIGMAIGAVVLLQGMFLTSFNLARQNDFGIIMMYALVFVPLIIAAFFLTTGSERFRRSIFYRPARAPRKGETA